MTDEEERQRLARSAALSLVALNPDGLEELIASMERSDTPADRLLAAECRFVLGGGVSEVAREATRQALLERMVKG